MKTFLSLSILFAVTVAGCTSDTGGDTSGPPDDDGGGSGGGGDPAQPVPTRVAGAYALQSQFDLATSVPGTAGQVVGYIIDATDSPDDPTLFIVERLAAALPSGPIKSAVVAATPFVAGYLNDRVLEIAPAFVTRMLKLAGGLGQVTRSFGTLETLEVDAAGSATKVVTGLHFEIDGIAHELPFADHGLPETRVAGLAVALARTGLVTIGEHAVPLGYGQVLRLAVDRALIPMIDPAATNLGQLLRGAVSCKAVGKYVYEAIGFGSASTFEAACSSGLAAGASALYDLLSQLDGAALELRLTGQARGVDKDRDGDMDELVTGAWSGSVSYAGTPAPLAEATFFGARR
ncbi:MAG TPA: hypothetical protein VNO30_49320 [Kofleriaceae bacterium]|nr:hypothetical protein [Kofleriaceae bacterium]